MLDDSEQAQDFSLIHLLQLLLRQRSYIPFVCTFVCSFVLPILKFTLITISLVLATCLSHHSISRWLPYKTLRVLAVTCKYELVDVYSVILLVTFIDFVGISVKPLFASQAYLCYCLVSLLCTQWLCHCYKETYEFSKPKYARPFSVSLSNALLPPCFSFCCSEMEEVKFGESSMILGDIYGCSQMHFEKFDTCSLSDSVSDSSAQGQQYNSRQEHQLDVRQRVTRNSDSPCAGLLSVSHEQSSATRAELTANRSTGIFRILRSQAWILWDRTSSHQIQWARPLACFGLLVLCAYRSALAFLYRSVLRRPRNPLARTGQAVANLATHHISIGLSSQGLFLETLLRVFFLSVLLCISTFALLVCWIRPILEIALVPGQQRGFAIETSTRSLRDIFWRLYSMGHVVSGCGILLVFPVLATFVMYISSIGATVGACRLQRSAQKAVAGFNFSRRENDGLLVGNRRWSHKRRGTIRAVGLLCRVSSFAGDIAMPDVQSIGLLTSYFIVNNIDFFGARLPKVSPGEPRSFLELLVRNISGFLAMLAFGVSASQVQTLSTSFEGFSQQVREFENARDGSLAARTGPLERRSNEEHEDESQYLPAVLYESLRADNSSATMMTTAYTSTSEVDAGHMRASGDSRKGCKASIAKVLFGGTIRVAVALVLLLPIWQRPVEVLDIDLSVVVSRTFSSR